MLPNKILRTNSGCLDTSTHQSRSGRPDTPRVNEREKENTKQLPQRKAPDHRRFQWIPKRKERYGWRPASNLYVSDQTEFQTLIIKQRRAVHRLWSETRMTPKGYWEKATEIKGKRGNQQPVTIPESTRRLSIVVFKEPPNRVKRKTIIMTMEGSMFDFEIRNNYGYTKQYNSPWYPFVA